MGGLVTLLITLIAIVAVGAIFFIVIGRMRTDEAFKQIARIAVGCVLLIAFILAVVSVFFGGGGGFAVTPHGLILFAAWSIAILVALWVIDAVLDWLCGAMQAAWLATPVRYVIAALALIGLLLTVDTYLLGGASMHLARY